MTEYPQNCNGSNLYSIEVNVKIACNYADKRCSEGYLQHRRKSEYVSPVWLLHFKRHIDLVERVQQRQQ